MITRGRRWRLGNGGDIATSPAPSVATSAWTAARVFLLAAAAWHIPLGLIGFLYDRSFPIGSAATETAGSGHIFGIFESNGWHNLAAVLLGIVALYFTIEPRRAREVALAIGLVHVGLVAGLIIWDDSTFWIASNIADQLIHASTAIGGLTTGLPPRSQLVLRH